MHLRLRDLVTLPVPPGLRRQQGQTTIEVIGILVLVAALLVVVGAAVPTIHATLTHAMHTMLSVMFDGRVV